MTSFSKENNSLDSKPTMVEVRRKPKESVLSLVRRFSSKVRMSGILLEAKKRMFYQKPPNEREKREKALRRLQKQREAEEKEGM